MILLISHVVFDDTVAARRDGRDPGGDRLDLVRGAARPRPARAASARLVLSRPGPRRGSAGAEIGTTTSPSCSGRTEASFSARPCCQTVNTIATTVTANSIVAITFTSTGMPRWAAPKM